METKVTGKFSFEVYVQHFFGVSGEEKMEDLLQSMEDGFYYKNLYELKEMIKNELDDDEGPLEIYKVTFELFQTVLPNKKLRALNKKIAALTAQRDLLVKEVEI